MKNDVTILQKTSVFVLFTALVIGILAIFPQGVKAQEEKCYGQYGQEIECPIDFVSLVIEKDADKEQIAPNEEVTFTITVKNVGQVKVDGVNVTDQLPDELEYVAGDLDRVIDSFGVGEIESYTITAKAKSDSVQAGETKVVTNTVVLTYKEIVLDDTEDVVISLGEVLGATVLPETGSVGVMGILAGLLIATGGAIREISERKLK